MNVVERIPAEGQAVPASAGETAEGVVPASQANGLTKEADRGAETKARRSSLRPLLALAPYVVRYRGRAIAALIALIIASLATLAVPLAVRRMIDFGFSPESVAMINSYFGLMILVVAVLAASSAMRYYFVITIGERIVADLRSDVFRHLTRLSPSFFDTAHSGELVSRLTADTTQIKSAVGASVSIALRNVVLFVGAAAMMVVSSPKLSGFVLAAIPLIVLPLVGFGRRVRKLSRGAQDTLAEASSYASELIGAIRTLQAFTNELLAQARFGGEVERAYEAARASTRARAWLTAVVIFLIFSSVVVILWVGSHDIITGEITAGRLGQFVLYAAFAAGALGELSQVWGEIAQASGAAERLFEILNVKSDITVPANPRLLPQPARGDIVFDRVRFSYPTRPEAFVVDGVSFSVRAGEKIAVVGPSGAGKSTLFHLLLRFYDPKSGLISFDGVPIDEVAPDDLRSRIALVPQDSAIFAATARENIRFGRPDASDAEVERAAEQAHATEFLRRLPNGFETQLGERGVTLSGGQRQRIAIARAILRDAPLLLLDEATSALDAESETLVQTALEELMQQRTTLVIAHRLATVLSCDRILVMEQGRIVEQGTHASLVAANGLYARLARLQFEGG
ncbi:ABC transporter, permease/ATP-binding protein [Afipia carboxidovorans OM5]|uniref:ABC transporter, multidrug resistance ATP-binding permease BmrA n=1 Tax=Afipia carboxidovorans (strain ATCC 49405 / DSM 1227 / KCTC 32145 / OM5) TaxID=504832 RepID=B6JJ30_AFIC5|nr:ABC transporter transmembrane domain-containing protein [Afipia carboxidovorans]ACI94424.1 ABC transporter, permease/ATP-binding protein [Afipia carboxidovorans OM5]AEI01943.1 ABC transporter, multidrug resistance ATP-binding permease BmrA [Afipia carboxidovorans OM4]AEI05519.1 ABC transporter, multidrug resistance ATP-binding permease BmrA [Afipia carboxidovorans OM5]